MASLKGLLESGKYSDFKIVCSDGITFHVHRCIIAAQGGFFEKVCQKGFKEGETGEVNVAEDDPSTVLAVLQYLYGMEYSVPDPCDNVPRFHAAVYLKANFYQLADLQEKARKHFVGVALSGAEGARLAVEASGEFYVAARNTALDMPFKTAALLLLDHWTRVRPKNDLSTQLPAAFDTAPVELLRDVLAIHTACRSVQRPADKRIMVCKGCGWIFAKEEGQLEFVTCSHCRSKAHSSGFITL